MIQTISNGENGIVFSFDDSNEIGHGGNGKVYKAKLQNNTEPLSEVAVKIFKYSEWRRDERYERFIREIKSLNEKLKNINGVMRIIDYHLPDCANESDEAWYLMPFATKINIKKCKIDYVIDIFLDLAKTIKTLHDLGMCHRDIKPENIMILNRKACLCDFGLVLYDNEDRITGENESIGPFVISPPEYSQLDGLTIDEIKYFDVYLFAKTLWIFLKKNKKGFTGEYNICDKNLRLDIKGVETLFPINELITNATKNEIEKRIDINRCIELLIEQKRIINKNVSKEIIEKYKIIENAKITFHEIVSDYEIYTDKDKIYDILSRIIDHTNIDIFNNDDKIKTILVSNIKKENGNIVFVENNGSNNKEYIANIDKLNYYKNKKIDILLNEIKQIDISKYISIKESTFNPIENVYISDSYTIQIVLPEYKIDNFIIKCNKTTSE